MVLGIARRVSQKTLKLLFSFLYKRLSYCYSMPLFDKEQTVRKSRSLSGHRGISAVTYLPSLIETWCKALCLGCHLVRHKRLTG